MPEQFADAVRPVAVHDAQSSQTDRPGYVKYTAALRSPTPFGRVASRGAQTSGALESRTEPIDVQSSGSAETLEDMHTRRHVTDTHSTSFRTLRT
jgi:hypothetical protein